MNRLFLVSGPSGAGKSTIVNSSTANRVITTTTRKPREGEQEAVDYFFVTKDTFRKKIINNEMMEFAEYENNYYGLTKEEFERKLEQGDVFIVCDIQGTREYKKQYPDAITIFIYTTFPSIKRQLVNRKEPEKEIKNRLNLYEHEMANAHEFDFQIENTYGQLEKTIQQFKKVIKSN